MRAFIAVLLTLVLRVAVAYEFVKSSTSAVGSEVTYANSVRFMFDTDGRQIDAYGAKVNCAGSCLYKHSS
jgi:hypothetical protein